MARNRFSYEKRRKELEKRKKKEAKREARAARKADGEAGGVPVVEIDEWGNAIVIDTDEDDGDEDGEDDEEEDPGAD